VRFNADGFPGDWHLAVERIVSGDTEVASVIQATYEDGSQQPGLCFFEFGPDGLIARIADYWPEPAEPSANRAALTERY
jgi:hypothetical protein